MAGTIHNQRNLNKNYVKIRWKEPYVSDALNKKMFGVFAKGVYSGFVISAGPGDRQITVGPGTVSGGLGTGIIGGYVSGNFDETIGYSIAVQQSNSGYSKTIMIPPGVSGSYTLDATGLDGERAYIIIDSQYQIGAESSIYTALVNGDYINEDPSVIVIGHVDVPAAPMTPIDSSHIGYDDPSYPRTSPLATPQRAGFMPTSVWEKLDNIFAWQDLCKPSISISNYGIIEILPSQKKVNGKRIYSYIAPNLSSKFPRNGSNQYNGGPNNDQVTTLNIKTGVIGGAHAVGGNTNFAIAPVDGTPNSFQVGLVQIDQADKINVTYGSIHASEVDALTDDNLPQPTGDSLRVCFFLVRTDGAGDIIDMVPTTDLLDARPFLNVVNGQKAIEEDFIVTSVSGTYFFTLNDFVFSDDHSLPDITVTVNGVKMKQSLTGALDTDFRKVGSDTLEFVGPVNGPYTRVTVRHERGSGAGSSATVNLNSITTSPAPDINGNRSLGTIPKGWSRLYLKDTNNASVWKLEVVSGVLQVTSA